MGDLFEFTVNRSLRRVGKTLKRTDDWVPLLFSPGFEGQRTRGSQGKVGAVYKASYFEITTSFAKDLEERFEIVSWDQYDTNDSSGADDVTLATAATTFAAGGGRILIKHYPNSRQSPAIGLFELSWFPDTSSDDKSTKVVLRYPTSVTKHRLLGGLTRKYRHRVDSADDLKQLLSI